MNFIPYICAVQNGPAAMVRWPYKYGEMAEWSKAHAWNACNRPKRFVGSNPTFSASNQHKPR